MREYEEKFPEITIPKSLKKDLDRQYEDFGDSQASGHDSKE